MPHYWSSRGFSSWKIKMMKRTSLLISSIVTSLSLTSSTYLTFRFGRGKRKVLNFHRHRLLRILFINSTQSKKGWLLCESLKYVTAPHRAGWGLWWIWPILKSWLHCWAPNGQPLVLDPVQPVPVLLKVVLHCSDRSSCPESTKTHAWVVEVIHCILLLW